MHPIFLTLWANMTEMQPSSPARQGSPDHTVAESPLPDLDSPYYILCMQVGMAEWDSSLPHPDQGVVGSILSHDSL